MYSNKRTTTYTNKFSDNIDYIKELIIESEAIIIGAGAGLSAAAGLTYSGKRFENNFSDFIEKYHFSDMYSGGFYPFESLPEFWAYWSRYVFINRYAETTNGLYKVLLEKVKNKNYFVLTTNVDHQFQKAGFDKQRLFYTQGDYGLFQCSQPCHNSTYDNEDIIRKMVIYQKDMRIPQKLIPLCPKCGKPMSMNLRSDEKFVQDSGWYSASDRYSEFLNKNNNSRAVFLELGVGMNTPGIIKYSFWNMAHKWPRAVYICINLNKSNALGETIKYGKNFIFINEDIGKVVNQL
ncbi:MAG: Sir2 silent information regulator family NAD-dependent deacetylase [Oscillospiraceae bacterium]|jgi:SIR2 family protein|nr:MAG: Sir2 silent information regulator family NAD-dependent deacetylase [Oscillospiraceae bacterium]